MNIRKHEGRRHSLGRWSADLQHTVLGLRGALWQQAMGLPSPIEFLDFAKGLNSQIFKRGDDSLLLAFVCVGVLLSIQRQLFWPN